MNTKHWFVPVVDVGELLPFVITRKRAVSESIKEQERARAEMVQFITRLEKGYGEAITYIGMDIIESKSYERFMFEKGGFFEIMTEAPLAMNAHFTDQKNAARFCSALKKTLQNLLQKDDIAKLFIDSIKVQSEQDQSLTYDTWNTMKTINTQLKKRRDGHV